MALKAVKFAGISHFLTVNIYKRSSFADHLQSLVAFDDARNSFKNIVCSTDILQHGTAD